MEATAIYKLGFMQDILTNTPCKVVLEDFDFEKILNYRLAMDKFSTKEIAVLEEILYSPLKVSIEELCNNTSTELQEIDSILNSLSPLDLFSRQEGYLFINKEKRRTFEIFIEKFIQDFTLGLEYFKEILKLVPIHCMVSWFHIPRTSNNIFNSIVEKHFQSPKMYERYLKETLSQDEQAFAIYHFVQESKGTCKVSEILEHFSLSEKELEEKILFLEYHYILASTYVEKNGYYEKYLTEFNEWKNHKKHSHNNCYENNSLPSEKVIEFATSEYSFIKDMSLMLELSKQISLKIKYDQKQELFYLEEEVDNSHGFSNITPFYLARVINKNLLLGLIVIDDDTLRQTSPAKKWLETPLKQRTLITFKHPHNSLSHKCDYSFGRHDRNIIEVQKALSKVQPNCWILFEEFMNDHLYRTNNLKQPELKKMGKGWQYALPDYDPKEIEFVRVLILDWLFESGMIIPGTFEGKECFKVTSLGYELYT